MTVTLPPIYTGRFLESSDAESSVDTISGILSESAFVRSIFPVEQCLKLTDAFEFEAGCI
jgi:hypothetical protein